MSAKCRSALTTAVALLLCTVVACFQSGPSAAVTKFYRLIGEGEVTEATSMITGDLIATFGADKVEAALAQAALEAGKKGGVKTFDIVSEEIQGNTATLALVTTYENGETERETVDLVKLNGEWLILIAMDDK